MATERNRKEQRHTCARNNCFCCCCCDCCWLCCFYCCYTKANTTMRVNYENSLIRFCHYSLQQMLLLLLLVLLFPLLLLDLNGWEWSGRPRRTVSLNSLLWKQADDAVFVFVDEARFATYYFCCHNRCCRYILWQLLLLWLLLLFLLCYLFSCLHSTHLVKILKGSWFAKR